MQIPTQPNVQCPDVPGELSINGQRKDQICLENLEEYPDSAPESHNNVLNVLEERESKTSTSKSPSQRKITYVASICPWIQKRS